MTGTRRTGWNFAIGVGCLVLGLFGFPPVTAGAAPDAPTPSVDSKILSLEDVNAIVGVSDLIPTQNLDQRQPRGQHQNDSEYPSQCQAVFDQDVAFGSGYSQFRTVSYSGAANRVVTQSIAAYPNADLARAALVRLATSLAACSDLHAPNMAPNVQQLDRSTVAVCFTQCAMLYRATGPFLIGVDAVHFGDSDRIATLVLKQISDRVKAA